MSTFDAARHPRQGAATSTGNAGHFATKAYVDAGTDHDLDTSWLSEQGAGSFGAMARPHEHETPAEIDTQLMNLDYEHRKIQRSIDSAVYQLHAIAGDRKSYSGGRAARWGMSVQAAAERVAQIAQADQTYVGDQAKTALQDLDEAQEKLHENEQLGIELNQEFVARGGWTRSVLVSGGQAHRRTVDPETYMIQDCSTLHRLGQATIVHWMPDYSGQSEEQIVADAGHRACTVCYPSAPVGDERSLPSKMFTPEEKAAAQERAKREADKAAKKAKAAANAPTLTGESIEVHDYLFTRPSAKTLKTERAAEMWWVDQWEPETSNRTPDEQRRYDQKRAELDHVVEQLAAKRGVEADELRETLRAKVIKKNGYRWGL